MNVYYCHLIILSLIIIPINYAHNTDPPIAVEILVNSIDEKLTVQLQKIDSHLANENLPIYIVRDYDPDNLESFNPIIESIGRFSMYQDLKTSSAAVLFEKEQKFDGVIGVDYVISKLDYVPGKNKLRPSNQTLFLQEKSQLPLQKPNEFPRNKRSIKKLEGIDLPSKLSQRHGDVAYIEILVMVDNSMINNNILSASSPDNYTPIVSHVLTLFNNVDMLYAKVKKQKIKINIAGIIISEHPETFEFLKRKQCVTTMIKNSYLDKTRTIVHSLDEQCTASAIGSYILQFKNNYKLRNSFDNIIFLTGLFIHTYSTKGNNIVNLLKGFQTDIEFPNEEEGEYPTMFKIGTITGDKHFKYYVAVAHELAHGFSVKEHDLEPYIDEHGDCCTYIMREDNNFCKRCLEWSSKTEEIFQRYFHSPASCIYWNKPKSLRSGPFRIMSKNKQCKCYGFSHSWLSYRKLINPFTTNVCKNLLKCVDETGRIVAPTYPMDGTPCGIRKVCWARKCKQIES